MKKALIQIIIFLLITAGLTGCSNTTNLTKTTNTANTDSNSGNKKLSIVTTIFPPYDFARQICGSDADVTMLLPPGAESHTFEPTAQDIIKIQNCDLFIYVGGPSDSWVNQILDSMDHPVKTVKMIDQVNVVNEEIIDGMTTEAPSDENASDGSSSADIDEHVWTSPKNAVKIVQAIGKAICEADSKNSVDYTANMNNYVDKLNQLDKDFTDFFAMVQNKTLIFGDRFPFRYFADEYGLTCYAAFPGCSAETEASAGTIKFLIDKVKAENVSTVYYIEFSNHQIADSIAEATNTKTALLDSCHNVSSDELQNGATYVSIMENNLETLKETMT